VSDRTPPGRIAESEHPDPTRPDPTNKEKNTVQDKPARVLESEFDQWWEQCWRKQAKPDAFKAFKAARKTTELAVLIAGRDAYKLLNAGQDKTHLKMPAGWLRDRRWEDEQIPFVAPDAPWAPTAPTIRPVGRFEECPIHPHYPKGDHLHPCDACLRDEQEGREF